VIAMVRRERIDPLLGWFLVTTVLCCLRTRDLPGVNITAAGTSITITPTDAAVGILAVLCAVTLVRHGGLGRETLLVLLPAAAFAVWLLATAAANGGSALVAGMKFVDTGVLAVAAVLVLKDRRPLMLLLATLVAVNVAADVYGIRQFLPHPSARHPSFLGEHDFAGLSTMTLSIWFAYTFAGRGRARRLALATGVVGAIGVTLGAALASLIGLYLALAAVVAVSLARGQFRWKALAACAAATLLITGGVLEIRQNNLGFLQAWFGGTNKEQSSGPQPGAWSQRLIFAYMGWHIFVAHPVLGTGWYPQLPPKEYVRFLPETKRRFPDQPANYFPQPDGTFIPQMTYDQVLYELGLVGAVLFLAVLAMAIRASVAAGRAPPDPRAPLDAYIAPAWTASLLGVLAGAALYGGDAITVILWVTLGAAAALAARANTLRGDAAPRTAS